MEGSARPRRFVLRLGIPEVRDLFERWRKARERGTLGVAEAELADRVGKALVHLIEDPLHPGLRSHEIDALSARYGTKVFQSYVDNASENAWRLYWVYGPKRGEITWIGLEPHPEDDKNAGYDRVRLSALPPLSSMKKARGK